MLEVCVGSLPSNSYAYTNCVYVTKEDFMRLVSSCPRGLTTKEEIKKCGLNVLLNQETVFALKASSSIEEGQIGMGSLQRQTAKLAMNRPCSVQVFRPPNHNFMMAKTAFELQLLKKSDTQTIDCARLDELLQTQYINQYFAIGQLFAIDFEGIPMKLKCTKVELAIVQNQEDDGRSSDRSSLQTTRGQFLTGTKVSFTKAKDSPIKLINQSGSGGSANAVFKSDFDFSKLGIGGLDQQFENIFRRAFASRQFPPEMIRKMGLNYVRGMLLFGPPGCGKTLIARQIGAVLNAKDPKIVNGPEILDKFVGESERKVRDLFADARAEQEEKGDDSELHIIIFDEIDAICKARGSSRDGTGVGDSVVNQLLTQIDGVDSLNNVLVIGMTNRKDMLDEALLRPGRLEVQIEISLPDETGRAQILQIHTKKARENGNLHDSVIEDIQLSLNKNNNDNQEITLAKRTKNFSGAEIEGLVRSAFSVAVFRGVNSKSYSAQDNFNPMVTMEDFEQAFLEVKPKFGCKTDSLERMFSNGIINYSAKFNEVHRMLSSFLTNNTAQSFLLYGVRGSGKSALAAYSAIEGNQFPFIRIVTYDMFSGLSDSGKCSKLMTIFEEAYNSPKSLIILDDLEDLIEYVGVGPRFSVTILKTLGTLIQKPNPVLGRQLTVIGTTRSHLELKHLGLSERFDMEMEVPQIETTDISSLINAIDIPIVDADKEQISEMFYNPIAMKPFFLTLKMAATVSLESGQEAISYENFKKCAENFKL